MKCKLKTLLRCFELRGITPVVQEGRLYLLPKEQLTEQIIEGAKYWKFELIEMYSNK